MYCHPGLGMATLVYLIERGQLVNIISIDFERDNEVGWAVELANYC